MAFTVEDGTGLASANAFCSVSHADDYLADRGTPSAWSSASTADKEFAIVKATQYLNSLRRFDYRGRKASASQRLQWPRTGVYEAAGADEPLPSDEVPAAIKDATAALAALVVAGSDLQPTLARGGAVQERTVGPLTTRYFEGAPAEDTILEAMDAVSALLRSVAPLPAEATFSHPTAPSVFSAGTFENKGVTDDDDY